MFIALGILIAVGTALRLAMFLALSPGFIGISDSAYYVIGARDGIFLSAADPRNAWPAGYPLFLHVLHQFGGQLWLTILAQHILGVGTAVLSFLTVRLVAPAAWGLIPAAIVLLAGPGLFLEHTPMTETLFAFLIAGLTYSALRARHDHPLAWGSLAGLCAVGSACVRVMGLAYIVLLVVWLLCGRRKSLRPRALAATAVALVASLVLVIYLADMKHQTGFGGPALTRSGNYNVPTHGSKASSYWTRFANGLTHFWSSEDGHPAGKPYTDADIFTHGYDYDGVIQILGTPSPSSVQVYVSYYRTAIPSGNSWALRTMKSYESHTRLEGPLFMLLVLLGVAGIPLARGRRLAAGILTAAVALTTLIVPVAYVYFDARYVVPAYGILGSAGAIGAATLWQRLSNKRTRSGADA